jgi:transposase
VTAPFPEGVEAPVQYGLSFQSLLVYFKDGQFLSLNRISELCSDLYGYGISAATIEQSRKNCYSMLFVFEEALKSALIASEVLHADESGFRVNKRLYWLHSYSTALFTFYGIHQKRGQEAMDYFGILPKFMGVLVHDFWKPYLAYPCSHALCNAHHLRELKFIVEELKQPWAEKMSSLLLKMLELVKRQPPKIKKLPEYETAPLLEQYKQILNEGYEANPESHVKSGKRGRQKRTKVQNLLKRLDDYRKNVLAFFTDPRIPFTNNQAERDVRMLKVQQKISGCFRTSEGAEIFARIRSYISTTRKQDLNVFGSIVKALSGKPFLPDLSG